MMLGIRAHDFGKRSIEEHADIISQKGFKAIQLALCKAISGFDTDIGRLSPGLAHHINDALIGKQLRIAVLGCYINPVHPDAKERHKQLSRFKEHIRYARDFGCSIVATETGSLNADFSFHPDNFGEEAFQTLLNSVKELTEEAEKFGVLVAVEGVKHYVTNTPERIKRLLDETGSSNLQVIFDPVNLLTPDNYHHQDKIIQDSFKLFGDRIAALHAKDFILENGQIRSVQAGSGLLNYALIFKLLKEQKPHCYILMEDTSPSIIDNGISYLKMMYGR